MCGPPFYPFLIIWQVPVSFAVAGSRFSRRRCATKSAASTTMLHTFLSSIIMNQTLSAFINLMTMYQKYTSLRLLVSVSNGSKQMHVIIADPDRKRRGKKHSFLIQGCKFMTSTASCALWDYTVTNNFFYYIWNKDPDYHNFIINGHVFQLSLWLSWLLGSIKNYQGL